MVLESANYTKHILIKQNPKSSCRVRLRYSCHVIALCRNTYIIINTARKRQEFWMICKSKITLHTGFSSKLYSCENIK